MRTKKILFILAITLVGSIATASTFDQISYIAPKLTKSYRVSLAYYIDEAARDYHVPADLLTAILAKESMFRLDAVNKRTKDYGIGQINLRTIKAYHFDMNRITLDLRYSIRASAQVLSWFKRYKPHEAVWFCRYNVGTAKFTIQNINSCVKYASGVQRYQFETLIAKEY
jgi:soluble lytic murein transglycosylase-like protein